MPAVPAYKVNPASGTWSAPPYLHNGSVPNLHELLLPAKQRSKTFFVGREFDPVKVGIDTWGTQEVPLRHVESRQPTLVIRLKTDLERPASSGGN